jgi:hypothetical protein
MRLLTRALLWEACACALLAAAALSTARFGDSDFVRFGSGGCH